MCDRKRIFRNEGVHRFLAQVDRLRSSSGHERHIRDANDVQDQPEVLRGDIAVADGRPFAIGSTRGDQHGRPLAESIRALNVTFPDLMVTFSTEGLGGSLRRLRSGAAALAICMLLPLVPDDIVAYPLMRVRLLAVASRDHPLAALGRPAERDDLAPYVQLVLSDPVDPGSPDYGLAGERRWRFVDLGRRLDFLLAGFGWCRMPIPLIGQALAAGLLAPIDIADDPTPAEGLTIYAAHLREREPGMAGLWLLADLRTRLAGEPRD